MISDRLSRKYNARRGFPAHRKITLFELVVVLLLLSGIYCVLIDRLMYLRRHYETAEVNWTIAAIRAAQRVESATRDAGLDRAKQRARAGNPMRHLTPAPANYVGEFCNPDPRGMGSGIWYYDNCNLRLVYLYNSEKIFAPEYPKMLKFNVESLRLLTEPARTF